MIDIQSEDIICAQLFISVDLKNQFTSQGMSMNKTIVIK